jgi:hypothetical protein
MKSILITLFLMTSSNSFARETSVQDLFRLMNMDQLQKDSIDSMVDQQMLSTPQLKIVEPEYREWMHDIAGWDALKKPIAKEWKRNFNSREISDLIDFYKSPTGKKLLDKQPSLMAFSIKLMNERIKSEAFQKGVQRIVQLAKQRNEDLQSEAE